MEEILKSIQEEMTKKEQEFNLVENEIKTLEENYNVRMKQLLDAKEQIRGAYTALHIQLEKFKKDDEKVEEPKQEEPYLTDEKTTIKAEPKKDKTPVNIKKTTAKKTEPKQETPKQEEPKERVVAGLTPEEIAKINQAVTNPKAKDSNGNEIPDYLQTEYNK